MAASPDMEKLIERLHPLEQAVLPHLGEKQQLSTLAARTGLQEAEVMRAFEWIERKGLITLKKVSQRMAVLGANGLRSVSEGLPERRMLTVLQRGAVSIADATKSASLSDEEVKAALGILRRKNAIRFAPRNRDLLELTDEGRGIAGRKLAEELLLQRQFPLMLDELTPDERALAEALVRRKDVLAVKEKKEWSAQLTARGKAALAAGIGQNSTLGRVTPELLQGGAWKNKKFRAYDLSVPVPARYPGKRHFVSSAAASIRRIWLELGFKEMTGRMTQTAFWDLDTLFVPQDHPARDMQDTFYLKEPAAGELPKLARTIKSVHESGGDTGSRGWGGRWSEREAKRLLLRTHTTVLSAQTLAALKESELPAKFFAVGKVFRNETLDAHHLFEFYQVEGIVADPGANFTHLKGYLRMFYTKMGYSDVRIRPAHFPYTEPSCEVEVFHPVAREWLELGGAGIFRPEVVKPLLGAAVPVLAWGLGLDRIISSYYGITDIRDLYRNDLRQLREAPLWLR